MFKWFKASNEAVMFSVMFWAFECEELMITFSYFVVVRTKISLSF